MSNVIVTDPPHYSGNGEISCMDALKSMMSHAIVTPVQAYWWGCAFKYLWRWRLKNGKEDLEKAKQCLDYLLNEVEA